MDINSVLKQELKKIKPSVKETSQIKKQANEIISVLKKAGLKPNIGGSLAKGTMVKKDVQDVDVFVVFDKEKDTNKLERVLKKNGIDYIVKHGSRDYFQIKKKDIIIELIPVVSVSKAGEAENITDVSLMHVKYVKKHITKKLADDIRLAKVFCHAHDCYGAESYIQGFSGYALELLIIYFKGFINFLKKIEKFRVIDLENYFKDEEEVFLELNESKLKSPLVLIDPTYKFRNVVAGLGEETYLDFLEAKNKFLKSPGLDGFEKRQINIDDMKKLAEKDDARFFEFSLTTDKQEGDIAGTKMKKFFRFILNQFERKKQDVLEWDFSYSGEGQIAKGYAVVKVNPKVEVKGPPKTNKEAVKGFKSVHDKVKIKKGFLYAKQEFNLDESWNFLHEFEEDMNVRFEVY